MSLGKKKDLSGKNNPCYRHGLCYTKFYKTYDSINERCNRPKSISYQRYGGRGIKNEFLSFIQFRDEMYQSYIEHSKVHGEKNTTLERIDNDGNYNIENCRWATVKEQANNRRNNTFITYDGVTMTISQWAEKLGKNKHSISTRLQQGWSIEESLFLPPLKPHGRK